MDTNEFINKANVIHNNKYCYESVKYTNNHTKITIKCPKHGNFRQAPRYHLIGRGCPECLKESITSKNAKLFVDNAKKIHKDKYDYSMVNYINAVAAVEIICKKHGKFRQTPTRHLSGANCPLCSIENLGKSNRLTTDQFIKKAKKIHGDKYDYSMVNYIKSNEKVIIICKFHGQFKQRPNDHLSNKGCAKCAADSHRLTNDEFIKKASIIHDDKYDYSRLSYNHTMEKVEIICPEHGSFWQKPNNHLQGAGCPDCYGVFVLTNDEFINKSKIIHNNRYDYSKVTYQNGQTGVIIICPEHGEFVQKPKNHLNGHGCKLCNISNIHNEILKIIGDEHIVNNDRNIINPYELDIYLPKYKIAIECNGLFWHSYGRIESKSEKEYHRNKTNACINVGVQLLHISEYEVINKIEIIKSIILNKLHKSHRIYARKCEIEVIDKDRHMEFMNNNHIQGGKGCNVAYGLYFQSELVSVMSFNRHHKYGWEITRFANKLDTTVVGGASKLFKKFVKDHDPEQILTYADRRYSDGNLYRKLGFEFEGYTNPNYCYVKGREIFSRQQFQKHKLIRKLADFNEYLTEAENMFNNGYRRLWDAGHCRFIWRR